jgi:thiamine biosynthesis protein ThiS
VSALGVEHRDVVTVIVNSEAREVPSGTSVRGLIEFVGLGKMACAVEVNRGIVPRREHERRVLADGDVIELVTLVGGG